MAPTCPATSGNRKNARIETDAGVKTGRQIRGRLGLDRSGGLRGDGVRRVGGPEGCCPVHHVVRLHLFAQPMTAGRTLITVIAPVNTSACFGVAGARAETTATLRLALHPLDTTCKGSRRMQCQNIGRTRPAAIPCVDVECRRIDAATWNPHRHDTHIGIDVTSGRLDRHATFFASHHHKCANPRRRRRGFAGRHMTDAINPARQPTPVRTVRCPRRSWFRSRTPAAHRRGRGTPRRSRSRRRCAAMPGAR